MPELSVACNRFGYGARGDSAVVDDPRDWLKGQMKRYNPRPPAFAALPGRAAVAESLADYIEEARGMRRGNETKTGPVADAQPDPEKAARQFVRKDARTHYVAQVGARARAAIMSDTPFMERLVHFWANHFAVSADKLTVIGMAGMLEIEAIRPNILGRFSEMLLAVEQHPAMLLYLDQAQSIGPDSPAGARIAARRAKAAGLNENLAREILELHTLGVRTGYTQADVTELARALTGWTIAGITRGPMARLLSSRAAPGDFLFAPVLHEPGARTIMGKRYGQEGEAQARAILSDLAIHPATATHIATKLARHFVADDPPPALVERLSAVFLKTRGDLASLYATLIDAPEAWESGAAKFKTPWDWTISSLRALGNDGLPDQMMTVTLAELGQPVWRPGSPAGFDDIAQSWAGPDALVKRVDVAERLAVRLGGTIDARILAPKLMGNGLTQATAQAIARADSPAQGLALFLVSPEFLRR